MTKYLTPPKSIPTAGAPLFAIKFKSLFFIYILKVPEKTEPTILVVPAARAKSGAGNGKLLSLQY